MDDPGSEPQSPNNNPASVLGPPGWSPSLSAHARRVKLEGSEPLVNLAGVKRPVNSDGGRSGRGGPVFYAGVTGVFPSGVQSYPVPPGERSSPGASSLPTTDSPTSYQNEDDEFEEESFDAEESYGQLCGRSNNPYESEYRNNK